MDRKLVLNKTFIEWISFRTDLPYSLEKLKKAVHHSVGGFLYSYK